MGEGPGHPRRRLCQETRADGSKDGAFHLGLSATATLSGWDRKLHLDAQARLRSSTLHLEGLAVCGPLDHPLQLAGPGPPAALSATLKSIAGRRLSRASVSKNQCCPSEKSKILLPTSVGPAILQNMPLAPPYPISDNRTFRVRTSQKSASELNDGPPQWPAADPLGL